MNKLTLGSLFDGSGGFPLGGILTGIRCLKHIAKSRAEISLRRISKSVPGSKSLIPILPSINFGVTEWLYLVWFSFLRELYGQMIIFLKLCPK